MLALSIGTMVAAGRVKKRLARPMSTRLYIPLDGTERVASRVRSACVVDCQTLSYLTQPPEFSALQNQALLQADNATQKPPRVIQCDMKFSV